MRSFRIFIIFLTVFLVSACKAKVDSQRSSQNSTSNTQLKFADMDAEPSPDAISPGELNQAVESPSVNDNDEDAPEFYQQALNDDESLPSPPIESNNQQLAKKVLDQQGSSITEEKCWEMSNQNQFLRKRFYEICGEYGFDTEVCEEAKARKENFQKKWEKLYDQCVIIIYGEDGDPEAECQYIEVIDPTTGKPYQTKICDRPWIGGEFSRCAELAEVELKKCQEEKMIIKGIIELAPNKHECQIQYEKDVVACAHRHKNSVHYDCDDFAWDQCQELRKQNKECYLLSCFRPGAGHAVNVVPHGKDFYCIYEPQSPSTEQSPHCWPKSEGKEPPPYIVKNFGWETCFIYDGPKTNINKHIIDKMEPYHNAATCRVIDYIENLEEAPPEGTVR